MRRALLGTLLVAALSAAPAHAATPFTIGNGADPDIVVDANGKGHFAWIDGQTIRYCRLNRNAVACEKTDALALPADSSPAAIQGPARILITSANTVRIVVFVAGGVNPGTYVYTSTNNGDSFGAPPGSRNGTLQPASGQFGGRLVISNVFFATASIRGGGPAFQRAPFTGSTTAEAVFSEGFLPDQDVVTALDTTVAGQNPVLAFSNGSSVFYRRFNAGDPNVAGNWSARQTAAGGHLPRLTSSSVGLFLGYSSSNRFFVKKFAGGSFPAGTGVEVTDPAKANVLEPALYAQPSGGAVFASWRDQGYGQEELRLTSSPDGTSFTPSFPIARDGTMNKHKIGAAADNQGFAVWEGPSNSIRVVPLEAIPEQTTGGGSTPTPNPGSGGTPNPGTGTNPNPGTGTAPSNTIGQLTVGNEVIQLFGPTTCVVPGQKVKLRVTSKRKKKLAGNKGRSKITLATFYVDKTKKKDKKKAFQQSFKTDGFALGSKHKLGANLRLKQLSGKKKSYGKKLKGTFTMCVN
jgi:hypothetical protein